jgi:hypothetical protein
MIDSWQVFTNLVWIAGLAVTLAAFSYSDWLKSLRAIPIQETDRTTRWAVVRNPAFAWGLALTCLGAGLCVGQVWQRAVWLVLAACLASGGAWLYTRREPLA